MKFVLAKCPSCSGDLQVPDDKDFIICMYCGSTIKVRDAIRISVESNLPNLIKLIEEAIKNQNYPETYEYCNRVLENDITNYLVWYYKGTVISRIAEPYNLRILETQSCFENAVKNCPEEKINDLKNTIKEILYIISAFLFKLNENSVKTIETGENKIDTFFDNSRKIIQLLKFIPSTLKIEENKTYNEIISVCRNTLTSRSYTYHTLIAGTQQIRTGSIFISEMIKMEFNNIISECNNKLRELNPEVYAERDKKIALNKKKDRNLLIFIGIVVFLVFITIYAVIVTNDSKKDKTINSVSNQELPVSIISEYQKGIESFKDKAYSRAINYFEKVEENDSNYADAQEYITLCNDKLDEMEQKRKNDEKKTKDEEKKKFALEKKYKRIYDTNGWLHEKQEKLLRQGFVQYKNGYESSPDGSQQIATYYKKYEDGFYVHVFLQYSYSLSNHYVRVWVEK